MDHECAEQSVLVLVGEGPIFKQGLATSPIREQKLLERKMDKASGCEGVSVREYGVRLEENIKDLVGRLKAKRFKPVNFIVDIEKFFDTIDHKWMMECLRQRVKDRSLLRLIVRLPYGRDNRGR